MASVGVDEVADLAPRPIDAARLLLASRDRTAVRAARLEMGCGTRWIARPARALGPHARPGGETRVVTGDCVVRLAAPEMLHFGARSRLHHEVATNATVDVHQLWLWAAWLQPSVGGIRVATCARAVRPHAWTVRQSAIVARCHVLHHFTAVPLEDKLARACIGLAIAADATVGGCPMIRG